MKKNLSIIRRKHVQQVINVLNAGWCTSFLARNKYGHRVCPFSNSACRFCLLGSLLRCFGDDEQLPGNGLNPLDEEEDYIVDEFFKKDELKQKSYYMSIIEVNFIYKFNDFLIEDIGHSFSPMAQRNVAHFNDNSTKEKVLEALSSFKTTCRK